MKRKGPWSAEQTRGFLDEIRVPIRLACNGSSGHPLLASLWFARLGDQLWCATQQQASVASLLRRDPRCAFEVSLEAPPYRGVRGRARARLHPERGGEILRLLIDRYLGDSNPGLAALLLERSASETAIEIEPDTLVSWDYSERMGEAA
jgi:nitroimidazol reductase NimA-like FMN-containing flavoprotein (pyridoxamine 5'-phosphate oxidase superfamily)